MSKRHGCSCEKCKECCRREPGWFIPDEMDVAAKFLRLSRNEFISRFCSEHNEDGVIAYSPKQKDNSTECIFLDTSGLCVIHEVKPYECRKVFGCQGPSRHRRMRDIIKRHWR